MACYLPCDGDFEEGVAVIICLCGDVFSIKGEFYVFEEEVDIF